MSRISETVPRILSGTMIETAIKASLIGGAAIVGVPVAVGLLGFTAGGIAAGSTAAAMMSSAATAAGGGVVAGGMVATLQSIGAAGLGLGAKVAIGAASTAVAMMNSNCTIAK